MTLIGIHWEGAMGGGLGSWTMMLNMIDQYLYRKQLPMNHFRSVGKVTGQGERRFCEVLALLGFRRRKVLYIRYLL